MSRKFIFSQMFDVRPRNESGDLDLEKIEKIVKILNLRSDDSEEQKAPSERIIDLKNGAREFFAETEFLRRKRGRPKKEFKKDVDEIESWPNFYDDSDLTPSQKEIFSVLEAVEEVEQVLKNKADDYYADDNNDDEKIFDVPIKAVETVAEEAVAIEVLNENEVAEDTETGAEEPVFSEPELFREFQSEPNLSFLAPDRSPLIPSRIEFGTDSEGGELLYHSFEESWPASPELQRGEGGFNLDNEIIAPELLLKGVRYPAERYLTPFKSLDWQKAKKPLVVFAAAAVFILSFFPAYSWFNKVLVAKNEALNSGLAGYQSLISAKKSLEQFNFVQAETDFKTANNYFSAADSQIRGAAGWLVFILERIPGVSYFSSRTKLVKVGQDMSQAGQSFVSIASLFGGVPLNISSNGLGQTPISGNLTKTKGYLEDGLRLLVSAKQNLEDIKISSLPKNVQPNLVLLEEKMPQIVEAAALALDWTDKFLKILGADSAKKYLLIFQNNAEARPTGGFIGTYGVLDLDQGQIRSLFIDGIYNPDGQLKEKIIPPSPIQKISTAWSTHDANWFADFPLSAQKIMWFYEKTGGATPDGVISLTPTLIERLLEITGPVEMPEYRVTLDSKNFVDVSQYEIEVDYDKTLNQPKKILSDFAPKFIDKVAEEIKNNNLEILKIINGALKEKHILIYFSDSELEQFVTQQGWAGEILPANGDYLAVVNTNINGFKTDRVVKEDIKYISEIQEDGSIVNTVSVTRRHQGGNFDWYNKVNADYMRVFAPKGSELISVVGQTREEVKPPVDYYQSGFKPDPDISVIEQSAKKDPVSGTDIFEESGKTVFGNWVYVSPGESVTITYKYRLPFKLDLSEATNFSLTAQKQSGSIGSGFFAQIFPPQSCKIISDNNIQTDLSIDRKLDFNLRCE